LAFEECAQFCHVLNSDCKTPRVVPDGAEVNTCPQWLDIVTFK